jgi:hypothetical protein
MRICDYAKVADWDARLHVLAEMAEPERWTYLSVPDPSRLPVLDSYLRYTFVRLSEQGRIAESDRLACFNTGLLTPNQEEVFGVFTVSENFDPNGPIGQANRKWFLKTWARAGDRMLTDFMKLPELPSYWVDPAELVFNPALQVQLNLDHIIRDNLNRFPAELGGHLDINGVPTDLRESPDIEIEAGPEIEEEPPPAPAVVPLANA